MKKILFLTIFILIPGLSINSIFGMKHNHNTSKTVVDGVNGVSQTITSVKDGSGNKYTEVKTSTVYNDYFNKLKTVCYSSKKFNKVYTAGLQHFDQKKDFNLHLNNLFNIEVNTLNRKKDEWDKEYKSRKDSCLPFPEIHRAKVAKSLGFWSMGFLGCFYGLCHLPIDLKDKIKLFAASTVAFGSAYYCAPKSLYGYQMFKEGKNHSEHIISKGKELQINMNLFKKKFDKNEIFESNLHALETLIGFSNEQNKNSNNNNGKEEIN